MKLLSFTLFFFFSFSVMSSTQTILALGDSLTEGYQLSQEEAYPALIEIKLKEKKYDVKVINGGSSGATTASGLKRLDWYLKAKPTILILALGANDGLRGFKISETRKNLEAVIIKAQSRGIRVIIAGMKMPTNYGEPYRTDFEKLFSELAKKYKTALMPFLLEGVAGVPSLNLQDGIHPNPKGQVVISENIMKYLEPLL
jgi:acyl-CoA thioesterase-1